MRKIIVVLIVGIALFACSNSGKQVNLSMQLGKAKQERDSLQSIMDGAEAVRNKQVASFLTFQEENAEEAMTFYVDLFEYSRIIDIQRYQENEPGKEGTVKVARFVLNGSPFMCSDSYIRHDWTFTPAVSIFVEMETEKRLAEVFDKLAEGGKIMMPLDNYGFSKKFGFVEDRFGVSWQLNLKE